MPPFDPEDPDNPDNDPEEQPPSRTVTLNRSEIRALEKKATKAEEAEARASAAERKLAFAEAGISLTDPKLSYFVKGYDGELTAEAIQAEAAKAGFLGEQKPNEQSQQLQADAAMLGRMADSEAHGGPPPAGTEAAVDRLISGGLSETEFWREASAAGLA